MLWKMSCHLLLSRLPRLVLHQTVPKLVRNGLEQQLRTSTSEINEQDSISRPTLSMAVERIDSSPDQLLLNY
jgi:uncharacterized protein YlxP (DUF503 family)